LSGSTVIGSPVTVNVTGGAASASYTLPAGTLGGSYTINAVYNGTANYLASTDPVLYVANERSGTVRRFSASGQDLGVFQSGLAFPDWVSNDQAGNLYVSNFLVVS